jgi:hypothetical protein
METPVRTQDIDVATSRELYALDPDYVTEPQGKIKMTRAVFWSLVALRFYLIGLIMLVGYRFVIYAHGVK